MERTLCAGLVPLDSNCEPRGAHSAPNAPRLKSTKAWHLPVALVNAGFLAALWRRCQPTTSVLVVLVLYAPRAPGNEWSGWFQMDYDRIAALAGVSTRSVSNAFKALRAERVVQTQTVKSRVSPLRTPQRYRVHCSLYHTRGPFVRITAPLVTSREWARFPSIAARHLWLAERAASPIQNPRAFLEHLENCHAGDAEERLAEIADRAPSVSKLARLSGLSRAAVSRLRAPDLAVRHNAA
jgi:hypothetical protein